MVHQVNFGSSLTSPPITLSTHSPTISLSLAPPNPPTPQVLQSISNLQLEMDVKEVCMKPMSDILPNGVKRLKMFIQELVQIDQQEGMVMTCSLCDL